MTVRPVTPPALATLLADRIAGRPGLVRVAIDGPPCSTPQALAAALVEPLHTAGRQAVHVRAEHFWRDASVRLEYRHEDPDAYLDWLDAGALRREVLEAARAHCSYLPTLRDPDTNRSTRAEPEPLDGDAVVLVSGTFLLGLALPFDLTVHLALTAAARERRTPPEQAWTLPAFERYDTEAVPADLADVVVRWDDPRRPAIVEPA